MGRTKNIKKGISMGLINNIISIILPFISRTIIIRYLGTEYVGLGSLFTSILQVLSLSELGFGAASSYLLYKPLAEGNREKVNAVLAFLRKTYFVVGLIILVLSIAIFPFLDKLIAGDVPDGINIYVLFYLHVLSTVSSYFLFAYKRVLLSANQRYDVDVGINTIVLIIQYALQIIVLILFRNYYLFAIMVPVMTAVNNLVAIIAVRKIVPGYKCQGKLDKEEISDVLKNTGGAFFSKIGSTVYLSVDNIVISAFLGLAILGIYNNYYYVISSIVLIFAVIHNSIRPAVGNVIATENETVVWDWFKKVNYIYMLIVAICSVCCYTLFQDFERIWCGEKDVLEFNIVILFVVYFYTGRMICVLSVFQEAAGKLWAGKFIPLISAGFNLALNLILVRYIGLSGILISSIAATVLITIPGNLYIIFDKLFDKGKRKEYIRDQAFVLLQLLVIIAIFSFTICKWQAGGWLTLILKGIVCVIGSCVLLGICNVRNRWILGLAKRLITGEKKPKMTE